VGACRERHVSAIVDEHLRRRRGFQDPPREPDQRGPLEVALAELDELDAGASRFCRLGDEPLDLDFQARARREAMAVGDEADDGGHGRCAVLAPLVLQNAGVTCMLAPGPGEAAPDRRGRADYPPGGSGAELCAPLIVHHRIWLHVLDRDLEAATEAARNASLPEAFDWQVWFVPKAQWLGEISRLRKQPDVARAHYETARRLLEGRATQFPDDPRYHGSRGIVYAGLGRSDEAVRSVRKGAELPPITKEAYRGLYAVEALALVYATTGDREAAVSQIGDLLSRPSHVSAAMFRLDPRWDPLRGHQGFEQLLRQETN